MYLNKVDAEEDGYAVKAVANVAVSVLHQQLDSLPEDVVEDLQGRGCVKDEEFRHEQKLTTGIVHHSVLQENINKSGRTAKLYLNGPEQHFKRIFLLRLLLRVRHYYRCLQLLR